MATLSFISGVIGNIISVLYMLSPVPTFSRIVKHRSTEEFESLPYVSSLATSSLWVFYGLMKSGGLLIATVNGFGIIIELVYVILFLIFAPTRMRAKTAILVVTLNVGFPAGVVLITLIVMDGDLRLDVLGIVCAVLNILMYGSPFTAMVPNGIGFILGAAQIVLYAMYWKSKTSQNLSDVLEDEWQHKLLIHENSEE
ncbi:hypothetical protein VitviT2T_020900 [Vitis vinifera]|uniref:Bidirectional sugar transporter SWEET n=1 Tax=Vitis vinifera TaxID=29760 RepID=A0ABY9D898_VITVI|nr:bidirectional sugar transporter SWEET17-like [Vitis vinifera]WKA02746.1 hypothetical protein VitviT2T_020900 [Vitis vinifera]